MGWEWIVVLGVLLVLIIGMNFYSRKRQAKQAGEMQQKLVVGAKIITIGGIVGTLCELNEKDNTMTLEINDGVKMTFVRGALHSIMTDEKKDGAEAAEAKQDDAPVDYDK